MEPAQSRGLAQLEQRVCEQGVTQFDQLTGTPHETFELVLQADDRWLDRAPNERETSQRVRGWLVETLDSSGEGVEQRRRRLAVVDQDVEEQGIAVRGLDQASELGTRQLRMNLTGEPERVRRVEWCQINGAARPEESGYGIAPTRRS